MENLITKQQYGLVYCRVSTKKQGLEGESLELQELISRDIAERNNLEVLKVFTELYSGRKDDRPAMDEMFSYIKKHPKKIKAVIFRAIDRFTREGTLGYESLKQRLAKLGVDVIDSNGIIQPSQNTLEHLGIEYSWSRTRPSEIAELVVAHQGKSEITTILTRMIGQQIILTRQGYKIGKSLDGYVIKKITDENGKKKCIEVPDPERAYFVIKMFEMRASGAFSDEQIVSQINAMGYKTPLRNKYSTDEHKLIGNIGGIKLTVKRLQRIINKPSYCAVMNGKWNEKPIKAKWKGLVSIHLFNLANRNDVFIEEIKNGDIKIHHDYNPSQIKRMKNNPLFLHKKVVLCPICKKPFLGSSPKGKSGIGVPTYHCSRKHKYYGVNKKEFERKLFEFLATLKQKPDFINSFKETALDKLKEKESELGHISIKVSENLSELEMQMKQKIDAFSSTKNEIIRGELEKEINELHSQMGLAGGEKLNIDLKKCDIDAFAEYAKKLMEHPEEILIKQDNPTILEALFGLVFDQLPTYEEIVNGTPKLSLLYNASLGFGNVKSPFVRDKYLEWNTIQEIIIKWLKVFKDIELQNQLIENET